MKTQKSKAARNVPKKARKIKVSMRGGNAITFRPTSGEKYEAMPLLSFAVDLEPTEAFFMVAASRKGKEAMGHHVVKKYLKEAGVKDC